MCFQESFNTTVSSRYSVCRWIFFLRDHRRTSPFSNLFKILFDFGTELLLFPNCFISLFLNALFFCFLFFFVFFLYFIFAVFKAEIPIFHTAGPRSAIGRAPDS